MGRPWSHLPIASLRPLLPPATPSLLCRVEETTFRATGIELDLQCLEDARGLQNQGSPGKSLGRVIGCVKSPHPAKVPLRSRMGSYHLWKGPCSSREILKSLANQQSSALSLPPSVGLSLQAMGSPAADPSLAGHFAARLKVVADRSTTDSASSLKLLRSGVLPLWLFLALS